MSSAEFALHQAYMRRVPTGAEGALHLWSRLMAVLANGPMTRKDKRNWAAEHFAADPFARPPAAEPDKPMATRLKAFVASLRNK